MQWKISFIYSFLVVLILEPHVICLLTDKDGAQIVKTTTITKPNSGVQTTKQTISSPVLTYECSSTKSITIANISNGNYDNIQVLKKEPETGFCKKAANTKLGIQTCITANTKNGKVYLLYQEETNRELVAGTQFQYVELTCETKVEVKEAKLEIIGQFGVTKAPVWKMFTPVSNSGDLSLSINPDSNLHVGDSLTLTMEITGAVGYIISPLHCDATRKSDDAAPVPIWDCHSLADDNIISEVLWQSGNTQNSVSIQMFAFKFVDSDDVYIKCTANVCSTGNDACALNACTGHHRKRRGLNNSTTGLNIPVEHASVYMKVKDPLLNRSSGLTSIWYAYFVPVFVMISARLYL